MIISDAEITDKIQRQGLLREYVPGNVVNCGYTLRLGKVFQPGTGDLILLGSGTSNTGRVVWEIGPSEVLVVMTKEIIKMPSDLCGIYAPLNRLARHGVLLLNASIVEPGYEGPLSCFLVNFSSERVSLSQDEDVAKITFHKLSASPAAPRPLSISESDYEKELAKDAKRYTRSFMDVSNIEERAAKKAREGIHSGVVFGGIVISLLLVWSTFEPLISRWIWERQGSPVSFSQRIDSVALLKDLDAANKSFAQLKEQQKIESENQELKAELEKLRKTVEELASTGKGKRR